MPDYVKNRLTMDGIAQMPLFSTVVEHNGFEERIFDLNKIVRMPKRLNEDFSYDSAHIASVLNEKGYRSSDFNGLGKAGCVSRIIDIVGDCKCQSKYIRKAVRYLDNIGRYGYMSWYQWRLEHWGVRHNTGYLNVIDDNVIEFVTAWQPPLQALRELGRQHPGVKMELVFSSDGACDGTWIFNESGEEDWID